MSTGVNVKAEILFFIPQNVTKNTGNEVLLLVLFFYLHSPIKFAYTLNLKYSIYISYLNHVTLY